MIMTSSSDLLLLVGRLNYAWTNTESLLIYVIAHLLKVDKEAAIVIFLTLNTTRARLDLVERLSKLQTASEAERETILGLTGRLKRSAKTRNKYSHCIYSFDEKGEVSSTQLMRLVETDTEVKYGKVEMMDADEIARLEETVAEITAISKGLWSFIHRSDFLKGKIP
jgi:hypothetical protein